MSFSVIHGGTTLPNVSSIQRGAEISGDVWTDTSTEEGKIEREIIVEGIIFGTGRSAIRGADNQATAITTYGTLETDLQAEGSTDLVLNGAITINNVRLVNIEMEKFTNNPALRYTVTFRTDQTNPFSETVTLQNSNGTTTFDPIPQVTEQLLRQDPTIAFTTQGIKANAKISIKGRFQGTVAQVGAVEDEIIARCTDFDTMTLTIPSGQYTVKCLSYTITTPSETESLAVKEYDLEFIAEKNYSIESENLPHTPVTWGGISLDVTTSYGSSIGYINDGGTYRIVSESLNVTGEKHYDSFSAAESGASTVRSTANITPNTMTSLSGKPLVVTGVNVGVVNREGRSTGGAQRYTIEISITMEWIPQEADLCVGANENLFGIDFLCVTSKNYGGTLDTCGLKTQDTLSVSGVTTSLPGVEIGSAHTINGKTYHLTSLNINGQDEAGRYNISANGQTLDTVEQARHFLQVTLPSGGFLDEFTSKTRSATYKYSSTNAYRVTSVTLSFSGSKFVGSGNADSFLDLIDVVSQQSGLQLNEYRVTSVNVGGKEPFVNQQSCTIGQKQSISISYVLNFEADGNGGSGNNASDDATIIEDESIEISEIRNKYQQIQIPGGALIFKKTGLTPGEIKLSITRRPCRW